MGRYLDLHAHYLRFVNGKFGGRAARAARAAAAESVAAANGDGSKVRSWG